MGYNKFISYGDHFELYEYEKDIVTLGGRRSKRTRSSDTDNTNLGTDGTDTLSERKLGKRQDNAQRASLAFRRLVICNLSRTTLPLLVTLTHRDNLEDLTQGYKHFTSFIQALRDQHGKDFKYIAVPEFQKRGSIHFHALIWGLPEEVFLSERKTRTLARLWKQGFVYLKETDGNEKLSFYLAKYMAKAFTDPRLKNQKSYITSRNVLRPVVGKGFSPVWPVLDDYVGDSPALVDRTYNTKWLGKGRYRMFDTSHDQP